MYCDSCGAEVADTATACPQCGVSLESGGNAGQTQPSAGQSAGGQVGGGQVGGGQVGGGSAGAGSQARGTGGGLDVGSLLRGLPLTGGFVIGAAALVVPFVLVTVATLFAVNDDPVTVAGTLFFIVVAFESGARFVDLFVRRSGIGDLGAVNPSDYPSVEEKLANAIDLLMSNPEAALLLLYLCFPAILYAGGRYLARNYAPGDSPVEHAATGASVLIGALPVALLLAVGLGVDDLASRLLTVGLIAPLVIGGLAGLAVHVLGNDASFRNRLVGWAGVALGLALTFLLYTPGTERAASDIPNAGAASEALEFTFMQELIHSVMAYLGTVTFKIGFGGQGLLVFVGVVLATVLAGFVSAYLGDDGYDSRADAARAGATVLVGYVGALLFLAVALPLSTVFVTMPFGANALAAQVMPTTSDLAAILLLGGVLFPVLFGGAGGYLAALYVERQEPTASMSTAD